MSIYKCKIIHVFFFSVVIRSSDYKHWQTSDMSADIAVATILTTLIIIDIFGNSLVCFIIKRNKDMR